MNVSLQQQFLVKKTLCQVLGHGGRLVVSD